MEQIDSSPIIDLFRDKEEMDYILKNNSLEDIQTIIKIREDFRDRKLKKERIQNGWYFKCR